MGIFRQGLSESTVGRESINAKPTKSGFLYRAHTKVTGTDIPTNKFALDVLPYVDPANPLPTKRSDIPIIENFTAGLVELSYVLPQGLQQINFKNNNGISDEVYIATTAGGPYFTIPGEASLTWDNLNLTADRTLYILGDGNNLLVEIWKWT